MQHVILSLSLQSPDIVTVRALLNGDQFCGSIRYCAPLAIANMPAKPKGSFGTHFGENIKVGLFDLETGSFVE